MVPKPLRTVSVLPPRLNDFVVVPLTVREPRFAIAKLSSATTFVYNVPTRVIGPKLFVVPTVSVPGPRTSPT